MEYAYTPLSTPSHRWLAPPSRRWILAAATAILVLAGCSMLYMDPGLTSMGVRRPRSVMIVLGDSRMPTVPSDPGEAVPYVTIITLINYHYATRTGADFTFILYDKPEGPPPHTANDPVCHHPRLGWRAASWCKIPAVWQMVHECRDTEHFIFIDTDAAFRNESLRPTRHLDHLTTYKPIGFVSNQPWDNSVCAGYFFLRREAKAFLKAWWDTDAHKANLHRVWEQDGLNMLFRQCVPPNEITLTNPPYSNRIVNLDREHQFQVKDPNQLIHHVSSEEKDRYAIIQSLWRNEAVALDDREGLQRLLDRVNIRRMNTSEVALRMEGGD